MNSADRERRADEVSREARAAGDRSGLSDEARAKQVSVENEKAASDMYALGSEKRRLAQSGQKDSAQYQELSAKHAEQEARWNGLRKEELRLKGKEVEGQGSAYKYKHDRRENFTYAERSERTRLGERRVCESQGKLGNPDTTINWRSETKIGAGEARKAQGGLDKRRDEDAGHLIACQYGADPADRPNLGHQNFKQNEGGGTYHDLEKSWNAEFKKNPNAEINVRVEEKYSATGKTDRPVGREVHIDRGPGSPGEQRTFVNTPWYAKEGRGQSPPAIDESARSRSSTVDISSRRSPQEQQQVRERQDQARERKDAGQQHRQQEKPGAKSQGEARAKQSQERQDKDVQSRQQQTRRAPDQAKANSAKDPKQPERQDRQAETPQNRNSDPPKAKDPEPSPARAKPQPQPRQQETPKPKSK